MASSDDSQVAREGRKEDVVGALELGATAPDGFCVPRCNCRCAAHRESMGVQIKDEIAPLPLGHRGTKQGGGALKFPWRRLQAGTCLEVPCRLLPPPSAWVFPAQIVELRALASSLGKPLEPLEPQRGTRCKVLCSFPTQGKGQIMTEQG